MDILEKIKKEIIIFDGATGTMLQKKGLDISKNPEILNFKEEEIILDIHKSYIEAGANIIKTNTFGANEKKLVGSGYSVEEVVKKGIEIAKVAIGGKDVKLALDIGPIGQLLEPLGDLSFDEAVNVFKRIIIAGEKEGVDLILFETMTDLYEVKAGVIAAKEVSKLPIFVTMTFEKDGRTFTGTSPESMAITLESLGVSAIGVNCSLGPKEIYPIVEKIIDNTNLPVIVNPNRGIPKIIDGETVYDISPEEFKKEMERLVERGASILGGCCGTTPLFIKEISTFKNNLKKEREKKSFSAVTTPSKVVYIDGIKVIGERINPTGKKSFKEALINKDFDFFVKKGIEQIEGGAEILDLNISLREINEKEVMKELVEKIQSSINVPLQIDSFKKDVLENGIRYYNGKPIVNSVNGEEKVLDEILPLVKKYGTSVIGLTYDFKGIPQTAEERFEIAKRILKKTEEYGIRKEDVFIDCLTLTASANQKDLKETLKAVRMVKEKLNVKTVLGISNSSYGLPNRELINETFLALALGEGLDLPIINPNKEGVINVINSFKVLNNLDENCENYIKNYKDKKIERVLKEKKNTLDEGNKEDYEFLLLNKLENETEKLTLNLLKEKDEKEIIDLFLIPALDSIGDKYEKGEIFLPQLMGATKTLNSSFKILKENIKNKNKISKIKGKILLATVEGDIHDIGGNIVKVLLESYGYEVIDLGKDVKKEKILEEAIKNDVRLIGLSALMTTTVKAMEETIIYLKEKNYKGKIMVGGAVITEEYSKQIGAHFYSKDAKSGIEIAKKVFN